MQEITWITCFSHILDKFDDLGQEEEAEDETYGDAETEWKDVNETRHSHCSPGFSLRQWWLIKREPEAAFSANWRWRIFYYSEGKAVFRSRSPLSILRQQADDVVTSWVCRDQLTHDSRGFPSLDYQYGAALAQWE